MSTKLVPIRHGSPARNGLSARALGEKFNRSARTVRRKFSEPREQYEQRTQDRGEQIRKLRAQGLTMRAIAAELDCSVGTVHRHVKLGEEA